MSEICNKMIEFVGGGGGGGGDNDVYAKRWLETKLEIKYGEDIMFIEASGKPNVVCFKNTTEFIVNDKWFSKRKKDSHDKATRIVVIAAELILNNTHSAKFNCGFYPTREDIEGCEKSKEWLSDYLKFFLENILKYPLKQASICQAIANAIRPRSCIAPILFGVGAEAEHVVG